MKRPDCGQVAAINIEVEAGKIYWWCACGLSKNQPFCDGSHKGTAFSPLRYRPEESGVKGFCACKQTANPPFCDARHGCVGVENKPMWEEP